MLRLLCLVTCATVLTTTVVDTIHSSTHRRYCGMQIIEALTALCGAVKSSDQLKTGSISNRCCHVGCDANYLRRYCAEVF
ncbi:hypothetical protein OSTOST_01334 [Ostertagia ostertagi]